MADFGINSVEPSGSIARTLFYAFELGYFFKNSINKNFNL